MMIVLLFSAVKYGKIRYRAKSVASLCNVLAKWGLPTPKTEFYTLHHPQEKSFSTQNIKFGLKFQNNLMKW